MPLKVVFVLPSLHGGGAERAAIRLLTALPRDQFELTLYLFAREGPYLAEVPADVKVVVAGGGRVNRFLALRRFLATERFAAAVSFLSHFVVFAAVRASGTATRFVISQQTPLSAFLHDRDYHWQKPLHRAFFASAARQMYPRADLVIAASHGVADDLVENYGVARERTTIVPNPVDVDDVVQQAREPLPTDLERGPFPLILTAGRLAEAKNLPLLIDALSLLQKRASFHAWVLGKGELEADVQRRITVAGLDACVRLLGFQSNPYKFMAAADVFVLTSRYEGFGNVLIEAMASGAPVVTTASFGTRDIVQHERTGLLIEQHDAEHVAAALERMLGDAALRQRLKAAGQARALEFGIRRVADAFAAALRSVTVSTSGVAA